MYFKLNVEFNIVGVYTVMNLKDYTQKMNFMVKSIMIKQKYFTLHETSHINSLCGNASMRSPMKELYKPFWGLR
jgi:hypothetical protein